MADDICFNGLPDLDFDAAAHYGIKDQKWGIRNYQYENGSYTPAGRERYRKGTGRREDGGRRGPRREIYSREEEPKKSLKERFVARAKAEPGIIAKNIVKKHIPVFALKDDELQNINERLQLEESVLHLSGRLSPRDHRRTTHSVFTGLLNASVKTLEAFGVEAAHHVFGGKSGGGGKSDSSKDRSDNKSDRGGNQYSDSHPDKRSTVRGPMAEQYRPAGARVAKHQKYNPVTGEWEDVYYSTPDSGVTFTGLPDLDENFAEHWGLLGMKWGLRRFQNPDGTLTPAGKERYYGGKYKDEVNLFRYSQSFGVVNRAGKNRGRAAATARNEIVRATLAEMKAKKLKPGTKEYSAALTKVIKGILGKNADKEVAYSEAAAIGAAAGGALGGSIGALGGALGGAVLNARNMDIRKAKDWLKEDISVLNKYYPDLSPTNNPSVWDQLKRD